MPRCSLAFLTTALFVVQAFANAKDAALELKDVFSVEANPGRGKFEFLFNSEHHQIELSANGNYLVGTVFPSDVLPKSLPETLRAHEVIQLTWGRTGGAKDEASARFGSAMLVVRKTKTQQRTVPLRIPPMTEALIPDYGLMRWSHPLLEPQASDEQKLKQTFFAKSGAVSLSASQPPRSILVSGRGQKVPFAMQAMRIELDATLMTPFQSGEAYVKGRAEFALYWPDSPTAKEWLRETAASSLGNLTQIPSDPSPSERQLAQTKPSSSSAKKHAKGSKRQRLLPPAEAKSPRNAP